MSRPDTSRTVRTAAAVAFAYESAALVESIIAERSGGPPRFVTISCGTWRHPLAIPVVLAALAVHLSIPPKPKETL